MNFLVNWLFFISFSLELFSEWEEIRLWESLGLGWLCSLLSKARQGPLPSVRTGTGSDNDKTTAMQEAGCCIGCWS